MRARWLESRQQTPAQAAALLPLTAVSGLYGAGAWLHRRLYRSGVLRPAKLANRVVSVGSLLAGGTGKTPLAAWFAARLRERGHKVVLASRGYGRGCRRGERVLVVSDGRFVRGRAETAGDEPMLLAAGAPGVPVLVGRDRALVGLRALSAFGADVLVLDDGFQHHRLHRDLDILSFDGALGLGNGHALPRGPLREPLGALRFADAVGVLDGPLDAADAGRLERLAPAAQRFEARRVPVALRPLEGGRDVALQTLEGADVGLLAGLAAPASFRRTLEGLGARVVAERTFRDHHRYRERDLRGLSRHAGLWVTTQKDALKLVPSWVRGVELLVLSIELGVEAPERLLDWVEAQLR